MAIALGIKSVSLSSEERTWRINIETPQGSDPVVTVYRESVISDGDGILAKTPSAVITRSLSAVAANSVDIAGKSVSVADLATTIAALADTWRSEDLAKPSDIQPAAGRLVP